MFSRAAKVACGARTAAACRVVRPVHRLTHSSAPRPSAAAAAVASSPSWGAATEAAHSVLVPASGPSGSAAYPQNGRDAADADIEDPLAAITAEIGDLKYSLFHMLGSSHPALDAVAKYYFNAEGKHLRPLIVLLMSQATNGIAGAGWAEVEAVARRGVRTRRGGVDHALTSVGGVLNDWNPESMGAERGGEMVFAEPFRIRAEGEAPQPPPATTPSPFADLLRTSADPTAPTILPTQRRLANITEMIHVASLLHDDVIDASDLRRGAPSAPSAFGNKLSILGGDFLLGRASVSLSRLGSTEVVELMASVINNLVEGEIIQLRATTSPDTEPTTAGFETYMRKTYLKTASLMAKSARSAVVLGGCGQDTTWVKDVAYGYGRNLGIAFQLVDDMLDFLPATHDLGKPGSGADMRLGLATAPALFAWEEHPELGPLIARKFEGEGDTELALELVGKSRGMERTAALARSFASEARALVELLPESPARDALVGLTVKVVDRVK